MADCTNKKTMATTEKRVKRRTVTFTILSPRLIAKRPWLGATLMYYLDCKMGASAPKSLKVPAIF